MNRTEHTAFGWRIDRYEFDTGETYVVDVTETTPKDNLTNRTFYVRGRITGASSNPAFTVLPREAGFFHSELQDNVLAGSLTFTVEEKAEWWCVNWALNNRKLPALEKFVLPAGQEVELPPGTKLYICRGTASVYGRANGPTSELAAATPMVVGAVDDVYGLKFLE